MEIGKGPKSPFLERIEKRKLEEKLAKKNNEMIDKAQKDFFTKSAPKAEHPTYKKMIDGDKKMINAFLKDIEERSGVKKEELLKAMRNMSREDLLKSPRATVEALFKNVDAPFAKKIQAIGSYKRFIGQRQSEIKKQTVNHDKKLMESGLSRDAVIAEAENRERPSHETTVDLGLAILKSQKTEKMT